MSKPIQAKYKVLENVRIAEGYYKITLEAPYIVRNYLPTQFVNIKIGTGYEYLLRKPFSIYEAMDHTISIVYRVIGKGTRRLTEYQKGEFLDIVAPVGKGVQVKNIKAKKMAFIAGGCGIASLKELAGHVAKKFDLFYGVESRNQIVELEKWRKLANKIFMATDDGSEGYKGFVTDLFKEKVLQYDAVYCCGPKVMMRKIYELFPQNSYFIFEEYMACGIGVCMGCVIKTKEGYKRICKDGPLFKGEEIVW